MLESKFNLDEHVEKYNSGVPIPAVEPSDIRATLGLILRNRQAFPEISMGVGMEEVNALCGEGADTFAILLRAALVAYLLLERKDREHTPEREERLIQSLAKLDLKATEFDNPNAIEDRAERECRLE